MEEITQNQMGTDSLVRAADTSSPKKRKGRKKLERTATVRPMGQKKRAAQRKAVEKLVNEVVGFPATVHVPPVAFELDTDPSHPGHEVYVVVRTVDKSARLTSLRTPANVTAVYCVKGTSVAADTMQAVFDAGSPGFKTFTFQLLGGP